MPTNFVNLDALIQRADFPEQLPSTVVGKGVDRLSAGDLESGKPTHGTLRKPDFQRETSAWTPEQVRDLIVAFINEDLVPAVILWRAPATNDLFVIDGCHRLSSLIAWVHDDYGDNDASLAFNKKDIPAAQLKIAKRTRDLVEKAVGPYRHIAEAFKSTNPRQEYIDLAKKLASATMNVQWNTTTDPEKAQQSFFKINQQGTILDATELRILRARRCANAIAARAIRTGGAGHLYWKEFKDKTPEIEKTAHEIKEYLFTPPLESATIKTLDLPVAGRVYQSQTLGLLFEMVNITNDVPRDDEVERKKKRAEPISDKPPTAEDVSGAETLQFLKNAKKVAERILSDQPSSLGLHPAVYFYSDNGRHQPLSFLAIVSLFKEFERRDYYKKFMKVRRSFEDFLLAYKDFTVQIVRQYRGGMKSTDKLKEFFNSVIEYLQDGKNAEQIVTLLNAHKNFAFLKLPAAETKQAGPDAKSRTKSQAFLKAAMENPMRCKLCTCLIHQNALTWDHSKDKKEGGTATLDNLQQAHPFCNSAKDVLFKKIASAEK